MSDIRCIKEFFVYMHRAAPSTLHVCVRKHNFTISASLAAIDASESLV